jgi:hypothetical protein
LRSPQILVREETVKRSASKDEKNIGSIILIVWARPTVVSGDEVQQEGKLRCLPRK